MILLLVSSSFIASKYCWNKEVWAALERHKAGTARVIPIILRSVLWQDTPLGQLQVLPTTAKPVTLWDDQDAAFEDVVRGIRDIVENLLITLREEAQSAEKISGLENRKEEPEVELEMAQLVQLITAPVIAAQRGWKAWEATFSDVSVRYVRTSPSEGYVYVATGTNKKEPDTFWYTSPRNIGYLCKMLVELYGRKEAVNSSEWVVKEIFPFLN